jgi:DNA-binding PucR family transcriptional regulator
VAFPDIGVFSVLLRLPREELSEVLPDGLRQLLDSDPRGVLRETLDVYLASGGSIPTAAERLNLHRTSLYYRLRQIEARLGVDLHDGETRQVVHLGVKAAELLDALRS